MSNMICFNYKSNKDDLKGDLNMSNGGTSMFINILCLSGGRLAETESQKRFMVFLAEKNQNVIGLGTVGFDIVDMPWDRDSFDEDKAFMLRVIEGAMQKLGWETLGYKPNEEFVTEYLDTFRKLIERMTADDIGEGNCNHSSVLAWRTPGMGEPGGLPSIGSHSRQQHRHEPM